MTEGNDERPLPDGEAGRIIRELGLGPHPEGGWFLETFREAGAGGERGSVTQIYYLLAAGERSGWHRVTDATEIWHHYDGAPLLLSLSPDGKAVRNVVLGKNFTQGENLQAVVSAACWQSARSQGAWTLVGCTVAPAFEFSSFEMAPDGWQPPNT